MRACKAGRPGGDGEAEPGQQCRQRPVGGRVQRPCVGRPVGMYQTPSKGEQPRQHLRKLYQGC